MKKLLFILLIGLFGCREDIREPFTKNAWTPREELRHYNHRVLVLDDLMENYFFKGMNRSDIIDLLGEPEFNSSVIIGYTVFEEIDKSDGFLHITRLKFYFNEEQKLISFFNQEQWDE